MRGRELASLYHPITPTQHPRVIVGWNGPRKGMDFVLLFKDDTGDWDRSGPVYPTKTEALANVPARAAAFFGTEAPETCFSVANLGDSGTTHRMSMTLAEIEQHFAAGGKPVVIYGPVG